MAKGYRPLPVEDPDKNGGGATVVVACDAQHGANMPHTASVSIKKPSSPKAGSSNPPRRSITLWLVVALGGTLVTLIILLFGVKVYSVHPQFQADQYYEEMLGPVADPGASTEIFRNMAEFPSIDGASECTPSEKVGFAKTHKTASSTVQNIIFRYGLEKEWNIAMYTGGTHLGPPNSQYKLTERFQAAWLSDMPWKPMIDEQGYNAFAFHTIWDRGEVQKLLGGKDRGQEVDQDVGLDGGGGQGGDQGGVGGGKTVYFTILRSPVDQFESLYNYAHFEKQFKMDIEEFVFKSIKLNFPIRRIHGYLGRDQQFWDLGRFTSQIKTKEEVELRIAELEKEFDLVMISEDIDSSLVLLAQQLCWPLSKVTSLKLNARKKDLVEKLSPEARTILKEWLWADEMLYNHFKDLLEAKKKQFGEANMKKKVEDLRKMNSEVQRTCIEKRIDKDTAELNADFKPWSRDVVGFKMNASVPWCRYYGMSENRFIDLLRKRQTDRWQVWSSQHLNSAPARQDLD